MAIAVIGGLITSTLLSLVVIPAAYTVLDDLRERVKHRATGRRTRLEPAPQHD